MWLAHPATFPPRATAGISRRSICVPMPTRVCRICSPISAADRISGWALPMTKGKARSLIVPTSDNPHKRKAAFGGTVLGLRGASAKIGSPAICPTRTCATMPAEKASPTPISAWCGHAKAMATPPALWMAKRSRIPPEAVRTLSRPNNRGVGLAAEISTPGIAASKTSRAVPGLGAPQAKAAQARAAAVAATIKRLPTD